MRTLTTGWIALMLIAFLSGCARTQEVPYNKTARPAKAAAYHVPIYDSGSIHRPYKVIGTAIASAGPYDRMLDAIDQLKDEAREMGGDALIDLFHEQQKCSGITGCGRSEFESFEYIYGAKVIVWGNSAHSLIDQSTVALLPKK